MTIELEAALTAHRTSPIPIAVDRGERFGLVDPVSIAPDIVGPAAAVVDGDVLAPDAARTLRRAADELSASLIAVPEAARSWCVQLLLVAELTLRVDAARGADARVDEPEERPDAVRRPRSGLAALFRGARSPQTPPTPDPGAFVEQLEAILFAVDPVGIAFETNTDEYRPEAETIADRLPHATSVDDVQRILHEEFTAWFGPETAGSPMAYRAIAARVWLVWSGQH